MGSCEAAQVVEIALVQIIENLPVFHLHGEADRGAVGLGTTSNMSNISGAGSRQCVTRNIKRIWRMTILRRIITVYAYGTVFYIYFFAFCIIGSTQDILNVANP